jgi:SWI/SNF-related matrix-associated actin-dependent regulator 1 of chromatin subfamily A
MNGETTLLDIATLAQWGATRRVQTRNGERNVCKAPAPAEFKNLWLANKPALQAAGISWEVDRGVFTGNICWWTPLTAEQLAADQRAQELSRATDSALMIPAPENLAYLGYQKAGIAFALARPSTLLADEMGLGKTIQAIGLINASPEIRRVLIVCPASLKLNWAKEIKKWRTRPLATEIINGGECRWPRGEGIVILNYELLTKYEAAINARPFDLLVLDEAHYTKNEKAQRTKLAHAIPATRRLYLTGTPILNRPVELFPLISALAPERWNKKSFFSFAKRYCDAKQVQAGNRWVWDFSGASNLPELQKVLRESVMVRRLKKDVLTELPPKRRAIVELEADASIKAIAAREKAKWAEQKIMIAQARAARDMAALLDDKEAYWQAAENLRGAANAAFEEMSAVRHECALAKAPLAAKFIVEQLEGSTDKIVVFAHHVDVLEIAMRDLAAYNPVLLMGGMTAEAKQGSVDRFQTDPKCRVFVGGITAAGVGLTLTASSHVVFMELDWVPANISQAEDRTHRIGQTNSVLVQHLVIEDSLDAKMAQMIITKQRIADAALDDRVAVQPALAPAQAPATVLTIKKASIDMAENIACEFEAPSAPPAPQAIPALPPAQVAAAHQALRILAGMCDGAFAQDGVGFNKFDSGFGKALAAQATLSPKQAAVAVRLATKYQGQLSPALVKAARGA